MLNIHWCGHLKHPDDLEKANVDGFEKMKEEESDVLIGIILLAIPLFFGVIRMMEIKGMSLWQLLLADVAGLIVLAFVFYLHELIHAICCPKHALKQIYWHKTSLMTYCREPMSKKRMMGVLLAPNILLGATSYMIWMGNLLQAYPLWNKVSGLMILILLLGAVWDLSLVVTIMIRTPNNAVVCLSGDNIYYKETNL